MKVGLLATYFAAISIITWDEIKNQQQIPHPQKFIYATVVWAVLGAVSELGLDDLAALFGLGLVLTMLYRFYRAPSSPPLGPADDASPSSPPVGPA